MNKTTLIFVLCCVAFAAATEMTQVEDEAKYTIDQATDILVELLEDAKQNSNDLQENWGLNKPILEANIDAVQTQLNNKSEECHNLDVVLEGHETELANARDYVQWLLKRIAENQDRIVVILSERCEQNGLYIEGLKNDKIALKLVEFLRAQVQAKESFDFAQRKAFMKNLSSFLAIYSRGNLAELVELEKQVAADYQVDTNTEVHGRSDGEIGAGHVDNDEDELQLDEFQNGARKGWSVVRAELLEILNNLEETINQKIQTAQDDEVRSSGAAADFKLRLEHEIEVYQRELAKWNAIVVRLEGVVADDQSNVARCRSEETVLEGALQTAESDLEKATAEFEHKDANLAEEVSIFQEVLNLYTPSTASQGDDFKGRADDYLEDGNFDDQEYADRDVPDIDLLNSGDN